MSDDAFAAPAADPAEPVHDGNYLSTWWACRLTQAAVLLTSCCNLLFAVGLATMNPVLMTEDQEAIDQLSAIELVLPVATFGIYAVGAAAFLVSAISWWVWQNRIRRNLAGELEYGAHAWVWWMVPFANLYVPYKVHGELWQAAERRDIPYPVPEYMMGWWLCWLVYVIGWRMADRVLDATEATGTGGLFFVGAALFGLAAAALAVWTLGDITSREQSSRPSI